MSRELIHKFLSNFSGETYYSITGERSPPFKQASLVACISHNRRGKDVYFRVNTLNPTGTILRFNSLFSDLDAGYSDKEHNVYHPVSVVREKKSEMMERINKFPYLPHYIVETRNGYQVYWLIDHPGTAENFTSWNATQWSICGILGGDSYVLNSDQILRVPYTVWNKQWTGLEPFETSILVDNSYLDKYNLHTFQLDCSNTLPPSQYSPQTGKIKTRKRLFLNIPVGLMPTPQNHTSLPPIDDIPF